jgi:hypothetical protein
VEKTRPTIWAQFFRHACEENSNLFILFLTVKKALFSIILMADPDILPFAIWSALALAIVVATGLVYRSYLRGKNEEPSP